ncbi:MAG TPA: DHHA1 domain-containing protein [Rhodanobacteraceae bacterium]|nr:DHHA1 domain-containing protein [Rhodanobacteraceae bacterium]
MTPQRIERRSMVGEAEGWSADMHPVLQRIYAARGVADSAAMEHRLRGLVPPHINGMERACDLLADAIANNLGIVVVGDFDCDGATGTAVAVRGLRLLGARRAGYRVPNRFLHGYGLSPALVESLKDDAPELIVTVDNGIASHAGVAAAHALGMRVLVTDHHQPGASLPDADAIVNPCLPDSMDRALDDRSSRDAVSGNEPGPGWNAGDANPLASLAGVGVMFYVLLALRAKMYGPSEDGKARPDLSSLLDLVALGTVADLVPLDRNNRILVDAGLRRMRAGRCCAGIAALFRSASRDASRAVAGDLGFAIGPRINAAGRLEDMSVGIECLLADETTHAQELADRLSAINAERRGMQVTMVGQAEISADLADAAGAPTAFGVVLYRPDWHPGIVGLVASRLKDKLNRPVVACAPAADGAGELRGSARSIPGFHIRDALAAVDAREPGLILRFGGHAMAAGLSLALADLEHFRAAFDAVAAERLAGALPEAVLLSDGELTPQDFTIELARTLRYAGPWGQGFAEPVFDNLFDLDSWRLLGERHWRMRLRPCGCATTNGIAPLEGILFNAVAGARPPAQMRAAYQLELDEWNGRERLRLLLRHIEPA